jgi:hypothetical protein
MEQSPEVTKVTGNKGAGGRENKILLPSWDRGSCMCRQSQCSRASDDKSFCSFRLGKKRAQVALVHSLQVPF